MSSRRPATLRIAIIPARGNSKGIVRKNLHSVGGRPLLSYTVQAALATGAFEFVIVSSECEEILSYASELGALPSRRPDFLSRDEVHCIHVVLDVLRSGEFAPRTVVSMLLPTSPLRTREDIVSALRAFESSEAEHLVSVYRDEKHLLQLRRIRSDGLMEPLVEGDPNVLRQEIEEHYVVNGRIYFSTVGALLEHESFHVGKVMPFLMDRRRSVDIRTLEDLEAVERLLIA